jgi:hypothetical protein
MLLSVRFCSTVCAQMNVSPGAIVVPGCIFIPGRGILGEGLQPPTGACPNSQPDTACEASGALEAAAWCSGARHERPQSRAQSRGIYATAAPNHVWICAKTLALEPTVILASWPKNRRQE